MNWKDIDLQWFAAEDEGRTEAPSEERLRKAREEGRVAKSQDLNGALVLLLPVVVLIGLAPWLFNKCVEVLRFFFERCTEIELDDALIASAFFSYFIKMVLPIALTAMAAGILGNIVQNRGFMFSTKPIEPKFSKIIPRFGQYLKKTLFSFEGAFNVIKSILKVVILFVMAYMVISTDLPKLLSLETVDLWTGVKHIAGMAGKLLVMAAVFFVIMAIPDYLVQRRQFMESMKMTKQEAKQEYKELEGDPLIKNRLKQRMREMLEQNLPQSVAKANVIITNPTHYAVALQYDVESMPAPTVVAKGVDNLAQRIKELARENDIPIVENRPLARGLYAEVEIGDIIPEMYWKALSNVFAYVYKLKNKTAS